MNTQQLQIARGRLRVTNRNSRWKGVFDCIVILLNRGNTSIRTRVHPNRGRGLRGYNYREVV